MSGPSKAERVLAKIAYALAVIATVVVIIGVWWAVMNP